MAFDPSSQPSLKKQQILNLLENGKMERVHGLLPWGSNHTFLVTVTNGKTQGLAIYKPQIGERPLWDFPDGTLCLRERAAYLVSEALGWSIVPPTILREGQHGLGSVQWFIKHDEQENYFTFGERFETQLKRIALFDHIVNNADRKGGHCLLDHDGKLWAIDHGVCFHALTKVRTVIWDYAGEPIPDPLLDDLQVLCEKLDGQLAMNLQQLLHRKEVDSLHRRISELNQTGEFPEPGPGRHYPWPPV